MLVTAILRAVGRGAAIAVVLLVCAPMWLGAAFGHLALALGGELEHRCACGMVRGTCGCPECERAERQRQAGRTPRPYAMLRSTCDDNDAQPPRSTVVPGVLPPALAGTTPAPAHRTPSSSPRVLLSFEGESPPTPPPRRAST